MVQEEEEKNWRVLSLFENAFSVTKCQGTRWVETGAFCIWNWHRVAGAVFFFDCRLAACFGNWQRHWHLRAPHTITGHGVIIIFIHVFISIAFVFWHNPLLAHSMNIFALFMKRSTDEFKLFAAQMLLLWCPLIWFFLSSFFFAAKAK